MKKLLSGMEGLFPATLTPFDDKGQVNTTALLHLMERNLKEGAAGFFVGGSSAECFLLRQEERLQLIETVGQLRGKTRLISHVGALSTEMAIELGIASRTAGFDILAATPPFYYSQTPEAVLQYYKDLLSATDMPVLLYNFPGNTGVDFDLSIPEYRELLTLPGIAGLKHTSLDLHHMERMLDLNPGLVVLNGFETVLPASIVLGATGAVGSTFNILLPYWKNLLALTYAGKTEDVRVELAKGNRVIDEINACGLIASIKHILTRQGIPAGQPRKPFLPLTPDQETRIDRIMDAEGIG